MITFVTLQFAEGAEAGVEVICLRNNAFVPGTIIIFIFAWYIMCARILSGYTQGINRNNAFVSVAKGGGGGGYSY